MVVGFVLFPDSSRLISFPMTGSDLWWCWRSAPLNVGMMEQPNASFLHRRLALHLHAKQATPLKWQKVSYHHPHQGGDDCTEQWLCQVVKFDQKRKRDDEKQSVSFTLSPLWAPCDAQLMDVLSLSLMLSCDIHNHVTLIDCITPQWGAAKLPYWDRTCACSCCAHCIYCLHATIHCCGALREVPLFSATRDSGIIMRKACIYLS